MKNDRQQTVTVLGCGGFIGSHLIEQLLDRTGYFIEGVDLHSDKIDRHLSRKQLHFNRQDVHDTDSLRPLLEKSGTVISLAALCNPYLYNHNPVDVIESNFVRIYPLIQLCSELKCRLIHFSTSEIYGKTLAGVYSPNGTCSDPSGYILNEATSPLLLGPVEAQRWCYASAKQLLERAIYAYGFERDLNYTIIRPFNFIGPRMDFIPGVDGEGVPRVIACFMDALMHGKPLQLVDGGNNRRCFTAISDAVEAVLLMLEKPDAARRKIFNIGNPENETTIKDLAGMMRQLYGEISGQPADKVAPVETVSSGVFYGAGYEDSDRRVPDIDAAVSLLGWKPAVALDEALRTTIRGFLHHYTTTLSGLNE